MGCRPWPADCDSASPRSRCSANELTPLTHRKQNTAWLTAMPLTNIAYGEIAREREGGMEGERGGEGQREGESEGERETEEGRGREREK